MGLFSRLPPFKLEVEGAPGREKALENDDLLPVPLHRRCVSPSIFRPSTYGS